MNGGVILSRHIGSGDKPIFSTYIAYVIDRYGKYSIWHPCAAAWFPLVHAYLRMQSDPLLSQRFLAKIQRGDLFARTPLIKSEPTAPTQLLDRLNHRPTYEDVFRVIRLYDEGVFNHTESEQYRELLQSFANNWVNTFKQQLLIAGQLPNRDIAQSAIERTMLYSSTIEGFINPVPEAVILFWRHQLNIPHTSAARKLLSDPFKYITELQLKSCGKPFLKPDRVRELKNYFSIFNFNAPALDTSWEKYIQKPLRFEDLDD